MAYYTLVSKRETIVCGVFGLSQYGIEFGDYDLETVKQELNDMVYCGDVKRKNCKIIKTKTARQSEIDVELAKLNSSI